MPWGAVAGAAISAGGAYLNSKKGAQTGSTNTSDSPETQQATNTALADAETIANRGYTPYGGQVVAPMSGNEQQAYGQAAPDSALNTQATQDFGKATSALDSVKSYNNANLQQYMDPYVSSVLTPELNQENINYNQQKSALLNSKAGAFGGDRSALEEGQLDYTHGQTIASDTGNVYSQAFNNAQNAFFTDQNKQIAAANAYDQVGGDTSKLNTQQIQDLMATGGIARALNQSQLDFNYSQFTEARDWSVNNLQPLLAAIGAAKGTNVTQTKYGPSSNPASTAIGAAATVAGAYFTGGKSTSGDSVSAGATQAMADTANDINSQPVQQLDLSGGDQ